MPSPEPHASREPAAAPPGRERAIELAVVILLIAPSIILSFFALRQGDAGFVPVATATILRDLGLLTLVLYFVWRNRESFGKIGLTSASWDTDAVIGVVLFFPVYLTAGIIDVALRSAGLSGAPEPVPYLLARGGGEAILGTVLVGVVAISEETIFRGYMIDRFGALTRSRTAAVLISVVLFALGHGYEGSAGIVTVGFLGLCFALVYTWRGSIVAPIVMHFLQDFIGIVVAPLTRLH